MKRLIVTAMSGLVLCACASTPPAPQTFTLPTGAEIALAPGTKLQSACAFHDIDEDMTADNSVCVEFPAELARRTDRTDPLSLYAAALEDAGLEPAGGAPNVYWFKVPVEAGCRQSLNLVGVPKTESKADDFSDVDIWVAAFVAEPKRC